MFAVLSFKAKENNMSINREAIKYMILLSFIWNIMQPLLSLT